MNENQIIDFLITQSEILGIEKENCPYYQIMEFIEKDTEEIKMLNEKCNRYEKVIKQIINYLDIDDETME